MIIEKSSGNIYEDLGFETAGEMQIKARLVRLISQAVETNNLSWTTAGSRMDLTQLELSNMQLGKFRDIPIEKMQACLKNLGVEVFIGLDPENITAVEI